MGSTRVEKMRVGSEGGIFQNLTAGLSFSRPTSPLSNVCQALLWKGVEMAIKMTNYTR